MAVPQSYFSDFSSYLLSSGTSKNTFKNYLSDIRSFLSWLQDVPLSPETVIEYRTYLSSTQPIKTANRRLSSLRKFCQFLVQNQVMTVDLTTGLTNFSETPSIPPDPFDITLKSFATSLYTSGASDSTVKNYLSDIRHFWKFLQDQKPSAESDVFLIYKQYFLSSSSPATISRRLSSVKKFLELFPLSNLIPASNKDHSSEIIPAPENDSAPIQQSAPDTQNLSPRFSHPILETAIITSSLVDQSYNPTSVELSEAPMLQNYDNSGTSQMKRNKVLRISISPRTIYIVIGVFSLIILILIGLYYYRSITISTVLLDPTAIN